MPIEIHGKDIYSMLCSGADALKAQVSDIDALNVFPVPDGDTGTNMNLSFQAGINEMQNNNLSNNNYGDTINLFSRGIMMGARGNSGVILSQLFRGMAQHAKNHNSINAIDFALSLEKGVEVAYKAVMKPVEGTILTVAREAAKAAVRASRKNNDLKDVFLAAINQAEITLSQTPDMLPVLKEVGVVDAGGKGLLVIYKGMYQALTGENLISYESNMVKKDTVVQDITPSQTLIEEDAYGYCTEFIIKNITQKVDESKLRNQLATMGESLVLICDDDFIKIHIHALNPGAVLSYCVEIGSLHNIKIDNMTEQHQHIINNQDNKDNTEYVENFITNNVDVKKPYGIVSITNGEGIKEVLLSLGVDEVVFGGQSMNPSTEDLMLAVNNINAENIIILPNNKNIILAAEQVSSVVEDKNIIVIPSKTIPEGIAAMLAFHEEQEVQDNIEVMTDAMAEIVSGQVTYAVRDTQVNGTVIKEGDILGIIGGDIEVNGQNLVDTTIELLNKMIDTSKHEILTIFVGQDVLEQDLNNLTTKIENTYDDMEIEIKSGLQPTYYFIISVE